MSPQIRSLVTGSAGFVGARAAKRLADDGHVVLGIDVCKSAPESDAVPFEECDIRDRDDVDRVVRNFRPHVILHVAAMVGMASTAADPIGAVEVNVVGTQNLLEGLRKRGGRRFVHVSTQDVYGHFETDLVCESHPQRPVSMYGTTKAAAEALVRQYGRDYGIEAANLRGSWIYADHVTKAKPPNCVVQQALSDGAIRFAHGAESVMDFVHVTDFVEALSAACRSDLAGEVDFNVGSGCPTRFADLCGRVAEEIGAVDVSVGAGRFCMPGGGVVPRQGALDIAKAERILRYRPAVSLADGLSRIIASGR